MRTQMIIRIDPEIKAKVSSLAKTEGKSISQIVREVLENYIQDRDISGYIDGLWDRVANKLISRGLGPEDIKHVIQEVRNRRE